MLLLVTLMISIDFCVVVGVVVVGLWQSCSLWPVVGSRRMWVRKSSFFNRIFGSHIICHEVGWWHAFREEEAQACSKLGNWPIGDTHYEVSGMGRLSAEQHFIVYTNASFTFIWFHHIWVDWWSWLLGVDILLKDGLLCWRQTAGRWGHSEKLAIDDIDKEPPIWLLSQLSNITYSSWWW